ncbi:MAG: hypothetical protein L0I92_04410 [Staphylococcus equorum]|nr:hypothetical protein [Staphylococcus equorum]
MVKKRGMLYVTDKTKEKLVATKKEKGITLQIVVDEILQDIVDGDYDELKKPEQDNRVAHDFELGQKARTKAKSLGYTLPELLNEIVQDD